MQELAQGTSDTRLNLIFKVSSNGTFMFVWLVKRQQQAVVRRNQRHLPVKITCKVWEIITEGATVKEGGEGEKEQVIHLMIEGCKFFEELLRSLSGGRGIAKIA